MNIRVTLNAGVFDTSNLNRYVALMSLRILCALGFLIVLPANARVIDSKKIGAQTWNSDLRQGFKSYEKLDFEAALRSFDAALSSADLSKEETATAAIYAGIIAHALNDKGRAKLAFERAISAIPDVELPDDAPPKTRRLFAEVKTKMASKPSLVPLTPVPTKTDEIAVKPDTAKHNDETPLYKNPWVWAGAGAIVVGAVVVGVVLAAGRCDTTSGAGCIYVSVPAGVWSAP